MAGNGGSQTDFAAAVLRGLGIKQNKQNMKALIGWTNAEGGHLHNDARWNYLNTTQPMPGAGNTGTQGNIKVYKSPQQGVDATIQTLKNGRYGGILKALKSGTARDVASAIDASPWGTHGDLVYRTIAGAKAPSGTVTAPPTTGGTPGFTTRTLEQTNIETKTDDEAAILDSLLAGKSGRKGASLASDIATRLGSGDYTTETPITTKTKVPVPTVGATPGDTTSSRRRNGKVNIPDSALYQGHQLKGYTLDFLDQISSRAGSINISSGTRAPGGLTTSGKVSDHGDGSAADIAATGKRGDQIAEAAFLELGVDPAKAKQWAKAGGLYNINRGGKRYQIIWKTNIGGNHYDHVHVGIRPSK